MSASLGIPTRLAPVLDDLTPAQRAAALALGRVLVLAGAGTGKTKTLTAGVATRIELYGMEPSRILCVTFTAQTHGLVQPSGIVADTGI